MPISPPLSEDDFWKLIHVARSASGGSPDLEIDHLVESLSRRPVSDIIGFELRRRDLASRAYRADLWGAAFIINGGCSDDGFEYFRAWLIAQGREVYESALAAPDGLADADTGTDAELEEFLYVADQAYQHVAGGASLADLVSYPEYPDLVGDNSLWSTDGDVDESKALLLYPRLTEKYLGA